MKSFFAIIALVGFAGVMLFGALFMVHSGNESHTNCLPTFVGTSECTTNAMNSLEYVQVHFGALTNLTNAIPGFGAAAVFAVLIILLYAARTCATAEQLFDSQKEYFLSHKGRWQAIQEKFLKWTVLHEKRDPSLAFAAST